MAANELPILTGSEKQIAWANDIREKVLARLQEELDEPEDAFTDAEMVADTRRAIELAATHTEAKWWITQGAMAWNTLVYAAADEREAANHD